MDPLSGIDTIVKQAFTEFAALTALVPTSKMQWYDRRIDARGPVEDAPDMGGRIWLQPEDGRTTLDWSSGTGRFVRAYTVRFGVGTLQIEQLRKIEWQIIRALARLADLKQADGSTPIVDPSPLSIEAINVDGTSPEREPIHDPQEWTDVCEITVIAFAPRSALLS